MGKNMFVLGVGIAAGMVIHHYVIERSGSHNPFDDAVDKGAKKLKTQVDEFKASDDKATFAQTKVDEAADKVADKADDMADKVSKVADKTAAKVSATADKAATKTRTTTRRAASATKDAVSS